MPWCRTLPLCLALTPDAPVRTRSGAGCTPPLREGDRTKLAVVGSGISGMTAAWLLSSAHEVDVIEAEPRLGGHTHTIDLTVDGQPITADTGFMVFNHRTYPNLVRLFDHLGISEQDADMSFSVQHLADGIEWRGDLGGLPRLR